jgi:hypothetical protein
VKMASAKMAAAKAENGESGEIENNGEAKA